MRTLLIACCCLATVASYAQTVTPIKVTAKAIGQLEDLKELTKAEALKSAKPNSKAHAEVRPELNRLLVISADEFVRVASGAPNKEAFLQCIDTGLARVDPLAVTAQDRRQVAEYFQELMEIVGLESSDGRLDAFVAQSTARQ